MLKNMFKKIKEKVTGKKSKPSIRAKKMVKRVTRKKKVLTAKKTAHKKKASAQERVPLRKKTIPTKKITKKASAQKEVLPKKKALIKKEVAPKKVISAKKDISVPKKETAPKQKFIKKAVKTAELDLKKELTEELIEKSKKAGTLTYEEIIEFSEKNNLTELEVDNLLRALDKENVELVSQDEFEEPEPDEFEKEEAIVPSKLKAKIETSAIAEDKEDFEEESEEEPEEEAPREAPAQITDSVKSYLRDIGKIPLLNKKTESVIAEQISSSK
ncbi:MAG: sigma-70 factor domain-containing protein, partial [bacterium]|nr:sigma-70 factor domain-containing protein [bacterium]